VKNHIKPQAEFIAPPSFCAFQAQNNDVRNFHYTPYLPTMRCVYIFKYYLWAERLWKLIWQNNILFKV